MAVTIFDIETRPKPEEELAEICPPFDPESVKCGNLGPAKAKEKIEKAEANHLANFVAKAALYPHTGEVCAIGYKNGQGHKLDLDPEEELLLVRFWKRFEQIAASNGRIVGFNSHNFDLPFIIRRSFILGIPFPANAIEGRYFHRAFVDLCDVWFVGRRGPGDYISLDSLCRYLGVDAAKFGDGALFHKLLEDDPDEAERYLKNDLDCTEACARKLRVC